MSQHAQNPNQLVVEDTDTAGVVISLGRALVPNWPRTGMAAPVWLRVAGSSQQALDPTYLDPIFKTSGLRTLGVIVDADKSPTSRWNKIGKFAQTKFPGLVPQTCPPGGLIIDDGVKRFGAWIMPDNSNPGMLEDLCQTMVPSPSNALWTYAAASTQTAVQHGATYKQVHLAKANVRSWLAWNDPPGEQMGAAIAQNILNAHASGITPFITWLRTLYNI